jgi:CubicO group peptidase (beta-lactamase class C family)
MKRRHTSTPRARVAAVLAACSFVAVPGTLVAQEPDFGALSRYIERELGTWKVPGLAIAVVKDDSVVFARGFGLREAGGAAPVDEHTLFAIGSASKAFTAAAVATLVDEGKLAWSDRAGEHLPGFELFDPYAARELNIVDLLSHRSGLPRGDLIWYASEYDRAEVVRRVRHLEPQSSFRSAFGYQNIMYIAAGELMPALAGMTWDEWVEARIFGPLGMARSSTSTTALVGEVNVATPHQEIDDEVTPIAWRNIDNAGPAGSINSSVMEMARWVRLHLNEGTYEGTEVLSPQAVRAMQTHRTILRREGGWALMTPASEFMTYGLGWFMNDYRGRMVVQHGGNIDGMHALVGMLPEEELGLVVLTNMYNNLTYALMYRVFDLYLGGEPTDWSARLLAARDSMQARGLEAERAFEAERVDGTSPSLALEGYAGDYAHSMYGDARVALVGDGLVLHRGPAFVGDLEHWHHDTFKVVWRDASLGTAYVTFSLDRSGAVDAMDVRGLAVYERASGEGS